MRGIRITVLGYARYCCFNNTTVLELFMNDERRHSTTVVTGRDAMVAVDRALEQLADAVHADVIREQVEWFNNTGKPMTYSGVAYKLMQYGKPVEAYDGL